MVLNFRMLTAEEVASILAVSEKTVYRLAAKGIIPSFKEGRIVRFIPDDINSYIQQRREAKPSAVDSTKQGRNVPRSMA